jgi:hypothetical protein
VVDSAASQPVQDGSHGEGTVGGAEGEHQAEQTEDAPTPEPVAPPAPPPMPAATAEHDQKTGL